MRFIDEYRDKDLVIKLSEMIRKTVSRNMVFMEVCGGHTNAIRRFGIPALLPESVSLISGPGCPVCVTGKEFIDKAIYLAGLNKMIIATFGDLMRIPGSYSSLEKERSKGADVRVVLSGLEALNLARSEPGKQVVFLAIGFETTAPGTAVILKKAELENINNFSILCGHKVMPPAMEAIIKDGTEIDGFICPGHVAAITGSGAFDFIPEKYHIGCVVAGFEPVDLLQSVLMLTRQVNDGIPTVQIQYKRAVSQEGNLLARSVMSEVFEYCNSSWRGLGYLPDSGLAPANKYKRFDAELSFTIPLMQSVITEMCICGEILRGRKKPLECPLFGKECTPENPEGACMVSDEGACNSWFRYRING